jgi:cell division protein FtsQ
MGKSARTHGFWAILKNRRQKDPGEKREALKSAAGRFFGLAVPVIACAGLAGALFLGIQKGWEWARTTDTFAAKTITFAGLQRANEADLLKLAGLIPGQNVFTVDVSATERAMRQHPWVREVEVERHLPSGISIRVVEHAPKAIVSLGELYLLDEQGEPFRKVQAGDDLDLPLVTGIGRDEYVEKKAQSEARFREAIAVISAYRELEGEGGRERLSEVRLEPLERVLVTGRGQEVRLGEGETAEKLERLARVRAELRRRGVDAEVIHLDNRARPGWVAVTVSHTGSERTGGR